MKYLTLVGVAGGFGAISLEPTKTDRGKTDQQLTRASCILFERVMLICDTNVAKRKEIFKRKTFRGWSFFG